MKKLLCLLLLAGFLAATMVVVRDAEARPPCPPGYFWDGPRGCMPMPYYPPPPAYYPPPPAYVPPACPPGTFWRAGACRPVPPAPGVRVYLPPIYIGP
ncbi:hypothetical protein [Solidesulfovibrio alcoholivorans]|uniref:hypothetical protein n=1 Tax=Solidesulfovibrio alcoholivorans TaxID=81406 RepID=UPI000497F059|nr:hypothetical protein [Solidesulfovibrio alcoholivorans]